MIRIKILTGITTLVLGIAGAIITMASNTRSAMGKIWTNARVACITVETPCILDRHGITCITIFGSVPGKTVFTLLSACGGSRFLREYT